MITLCSDATYPVSEVVGGKIITKQVPALTALNERLRDDYIEEIQAGVSRWNRVIDEAAIPFRLTVAAQGLSSRHRQFRRALHQPDRRNAHRRAWKKLTNSSGCPAPRITPTCSR